ncbi:hypothetical protein GQ473_02580 [archaeon]|nr:hypothetical protein [archaeon]
MIIDTLIQYGDQAAKFTVNNAVDYVEPAYDPGSTKVLSIGGVFNKFTWKESIVLISLGVFLPLGFDYYPKERIADNEPWPDYVDLFWRKDSDGSLVGWQPSRYNLPSVNYELSIGATLVPPDTVGEDFNLVAEIPTIAVALTRVSMLNVPDSLNDKIFSCPVFAKIGHTLDLT